MLVWIAVAPLIAGVAASDEFVLTPLCNPCLAPTEMYSGNESFMNFDGSASLINRSTPDGVGLWPHAMVDGWPLKNGTECNQTQYPNPCFEYSVQSKSEWWGAYEGQKSLPTNSWFTDIFSNPPITINPIVFSWPVYTSPYAIFAANDGLSVTLPLYLTAANGGNPGIAGDIPSETADSIAPQLIAAATERICVVTTKGSPHFAPPQKRIVNYDKNSFAVQLQYTLAGGGGVDFILSRGSPYVTALFAQNGSAGEVVPSLVFATTSIKEVNGKDCTANPTQCTKVLGVKLASGVFKYVFAIANGEEVWYTYLVYASKEMEFSVENNNGTWVAEAAASACGTECVLRVAVSEVLRFPIIKGVSEFSKRWTSIPPEGKTIVSTTGLDNAANVYPTVSGSSVRYFKAATGVTMRFEWGTACMVPGCSGEALLMLALPHHQELFTNVTLLPTIKYAVTNGVAVGALGNIWELFYTFASVSPVMGRALGEFFNPSLGDAQSDPFFADNPMKEEYSEVVRASLKADMAYWTGVHNAEVMRSPAFLYLNADCYAFGKFVAVVARLILIADELGEEDTARVGRDFVRCRLNQWLDPRHSTSPYFPYVGKTFPIPSALRNGIQTYDTTWGGLPTTNGLHNPGPAWVGNGTQPDFGSGGYNDHLFHYGYYLYSVSVVLRGAVESGPKPGQAGMWFDDDTCRGMNSSDSDWFTLVSKRVLAWGRDIANPDENNDPHFTQFRYHSDWYAGHSWARGLFPSGLTSSNIESSSEAMQAYYSLFLLGYAMQKAGLTDLSYEAKSLQTAGAVTLLSESVSIKYYWHMVGPEEKGFPATRLDVVPESFATLGVIGNLWTAALNYQVFFAYGICQWEKGSGADCPKDLTLEQIHWFNRVFIMQIQMLPYSPITEGLVENPWLEQAMFTERLNYTARNGSVSHGYDPALIWTDLPSSYTRCNGTTQNLGKRCAQGWMAYALQSLAALGGDYVKTCFELALQIDGVADGNTVTNMLWWIASRS